MRIGKSDFFQNFNFFVTRITFGALHNSENEKNRKSDDFDLNRFCAACTTFGQGVLVNPSTILT